MWTILKNKKGVTLLEGMIAILLLAVVTVGTFGVVLSSSRKVSQPDIREEMVLAAEQMHHFVQGVSPTMTQYNPTIWGEGASDDDKVFRRTKALLGVEEDYRSQWEMNNAVNLTLPFSEPKWQWFLPEGGNEGESPFAASRFVFNKMFLPVLCVPDTSSSEVEFNLDDPIELPYADTEMWDFDLAVSSEAPMHNNLPIIRNTFTIKCQGYGV